MASPAQILANTENAQHSTGPITAAGKQISKLNSFKHGLSGHTIVLPSEDMNLYEDFRTGLIEALAPLGAHEQQLAQRIADTNWRLNRIPAHEANLFALAQLEPLPEHLAALEDSPARRALIETNALIAHERHLRNLHLQEQRLNRELHRISTELKNLQAARLNSDYEQAKVEKIVHAFPRPWDEPPPDALLAEPPSDDLEPFDPSEFGFDFANVPDEELSSAERRMRQIHFETMARNKANS